MVFIQGFPIYPAYNSVWQTFPLAYQKAYFGPLGYQRYPSTDSLPNPNTLGGRHFSRRSSRKFKNKFSRRKYKKEEKKYKKERKLSKKRNHHKNLKKKQKKFSHARRFSNKTNQQLIKSPQNTRMLTPYGSSTMKNIGFQDSTISNLY